MTSVRNTDRKLQINDMHSYREILVQKIKV